MAAPILRSISPDATPEEASAIAAAVTEVARQRSQATAVHAPARSRWVTTTRLSARRAGFQRGSWRLSGRIGRRARA